MAKKLDGPKIGKDGKKDWTGFYASLDDKQTIAHVIATLGKMPMAYLKLLGARLAKVK